MSYIQQQTKTKRNINGHFRGLEFTIYLDVAIGQKNDEGSKLIFFSIENLHDKTTARVNRSFQAGMFMSSEDIFCNIENLLFTFVISVKKQTVSKDLMIEMRLRCNSDNNDNNKLQQDLVPADLRRDYSSVERRMKIKI